MPDIFDASKQKATSTPAASERQVTSHPSSDLDDTAINVDHAPTEPPENFPLVAEEPTSPDTSDANEAIGTTEEAPNPRKGKSVDDYSSVMRAETPNHNPLSAFVAKPTKVFFEEQQPDEKVLLLLRRHPVTQIHWVIIAILLALAPLLFNAIGLLAFFPARFQFAAGVGWYVLISGYILESFINWFFNVYIVTDERIIDVDFYNLLYRNIASAKIDRIQDITSEAGGLLDSIFNYGTVKIQTAGTTEEFEFEDVPQPAKVTAFLNEMITEEEQEQLEGRVS